MIISMCSAEMITSAAFILKEGGLVAFPTETVYGLGADAENEKAVARIYEVKGRPSNHPLIVHISEIQDLNIWADDIPDYALKLAENFWPGPMTLILKRKEIAGNFITGNQNTVGLRIPAQLTALSLINEFKNHGGKGIAAPSANRFGRVSPTSAEAVLDELLPYLNIKTDRILNDGTCHIGIESTIINCTNDNPEILRHGFITIKMIKEATNLEVKGYSSGIRVSGNLESHYSPNARVHLSSQNKKGFGFIALSNIPTPDSCFRLISPDNLYEFARDLYFAFRLADLKKLEDVIVVPPEGEGLALAIRDRILKSAASTEKLKTKNLKSVESEARCRRKNY